MSAALAKSRPPALPVEGVRAAARLQEVALAAGLTLKATARGRWVACCPFHGERTPSFTVWADHYHCFGCGAHGDAIDFVMAVERCDFAEAVRRLAERLGVASAAAPSRPAADARPAPRQVTPPPAAASGGEGWRDDWSAARPLAPGDAGWRYLQGRGLDGALLAPALAGLRLHPALPYWHDGRQLATAPALLAPIQGHAGHLVAINRIWLAVGPDGRVGKLRLADPADPEGRPLPVKKMAGPAGGGAVRFGPPAATLWLGEGIETVLSVLQALGGPGALGDRASAWALLGLGNFAGVGTTEKIKRPHPDRPGRFLPSPYPEQGGAGWRPPEGCRRVIWCADSDGKDPASADMLLQRGCRRLEGFGLRVDLVRAPAGLDFNDWLQDLLKGAR